MPMTGFDGCNSCASLAGLVLSFMACFILLVIAPLHRRRSRSPWSSLRTESFLRIFAPGNGSPSATNVVVVLVVVIRFSIP